MSSLLRAAWQAQAQGSIRKIEHWAFLSLGEPKVSHIVTVSTEVRDAAAVRAACRRLNLPEPTAGKATLFSGEVEGLIVKLPEWTYPIVCNLSTGQLQFDNFNGRWGDQKELDRFLQGYAVEKARIEVRKKGHTCTENLLADGSIKLTIAVAEGVV